MKKRESGTCCEHFVVEADHLQKISIKLVIKLIKHKKQIPLLHFIKRWFIKSFIHAFFLYHELTLQTEFIYRREIESPTVSSFYNDITEWHPQLIVSLNS